MLLLYHNPLSHYSRKVVVALEEKKVPYQERIVDLKKGDQLERWFLELNPKGEIPVLQLAEGAICDSETIMDYVDRKYGRANQLYPAGEEEAAKVRQMCRLVDSVNVFRLTYGVACFQTSSCTDVLRFPYYADDTQIAMKNKLLSRPAELRLVAERNSDLPVVADCLRQKADKVEETLEIWSQPKKFRQTMDHLEAVLDGIEAELARDDRSGGWLCGPSFTAADVALSVLLARLHQLGLDERLWKGGARPNVAVYQEMALERPSVEKATGFRANGGKEMPVKQGGAAGEGGSSDESLATGIGAAQVGLGAVLVVGGIYACRKLFNK